MAKWAYQFTLHDHWDYDGVKEAVLLDMPINGTMRHTLVHFDRNTYAYTIERNTGDVLLADNFAFQNWSTGFDMKTGRPILDPAREPKPDIKIERVRPPDIGQKDWEPPAFNPNTGLLYIQALGGTAAATLPSDQSPEAANRDQGAQTGQHQ